MSQENVEIIKAVMAAFDARDRGRLLSLMDPEIEFRSPIIDQKIRRGHSEMVRYREELDAAFGEWHTEEDRFLDAGGDRVLHLFRLVGRGVGSGLPVSEDQAILWQLRDGKLFKGRVYRDQRQALEAAGLRE
jgi:ketosteroid isomerase-like protein